MEIRWTECRSTRGFIWTESSTAVESRFGRVRFAHTRTLARLLSCPLRDVSARTTDAPDISNSGDESTAAIARSRYLLCAARAPLRGVKVSRSWLLCISARSIEGDPVCAWALDATDKGSMCSWTKGALVPDGSLVSSCTGGSLATDSKMTWRGGAEGGE